MEVQPSAQSIKQNSVKAERQEHYAEFGGDAVLLIDNSTNVGLYKFKHVRLLLEFIAGV
jgi:ApbE superfamily uncharacterized protein (UPF0280 family)